MYAFQARAKELNIVLVYDHPIAQTCVAAPVDAGIGATLKQLSNKLYEADYEKNTQCMKPMGFQRKTDE